MHVERAENPQFLSNAYLVYDEPGGHGILIDSNEVTDPLIEKARAEDVTITHLLLTHDHFDHVVGAVALAEKAGGVPIHAHSVAAGKEWVERVDENLMGGAVIESGSLRIEAVETPGHCAGHLAFIVDGTDVFTADVLFRGTVGGTRAPGATGFEDLKSSVMDTLMGLDHSVRVHPGHREPTTIGAEWESNPFIRIWRGLDEEGSGTCTVGGARRRRGDPRALGARL